MSTHLWSRTLVIQSGAFEGYNIHTLTYMVGHLAFQMTLPIWTKRGRPSPGPRLTQSSSWDKAAVPIWPDVVTTTWPPPQYLDREGLKAFNRRFRNLKEPVRR